MTINQGFGKIQTLYQKENSLFDGFERVSTSTKPYDEIIKLDKKFKIKFNKKADHNKWNDIFLARVIIYQISR